MIRIYSTPTCAYCATVKKYLTLKEIKFEERSAFEAEEYSQLASQFGMTVPLVYNTETGKGMVGFNIGTLNELVSAT